MNKNRKLIINADDLGISNYVNDQIEECIRRGVVTSSTLLANAPAFEGGVLIAKRYPHISIGVHLNIIEFRPLTNEDIFRKHGMLDEDDNFIEGAITVANIDDELKKAIYEEWDEQITRVEEAGIKPSHCDSHEHTHTIHELKDILCKVLEKHKILCVRRVMVPSIRLMLLAKRNNPVKLDKSKAMQPPRRNVLYRRLNLLRVKYKCFRWNRYMQTNYIMTDCFYPFRFFYDFRKFLKLGSKNAVIELMCHPGHKAYQNETDNLMRDLSWIPNGYELISYKDLYHI